MIMIFDLQITRGGKQIGVWKDLKLQFDLLLFYQIVAVLRAQVGSLSYIHCFSYVFRLKIV